MPVFYMLELAKYYKEWGSDNLYFTMGLNSLTTINTSPNGGKDFVKDTD